MDREKIISEWESVLSRDPLDAPYDLIDETLELLKREKVKPVLSRDWFVCECGASITMIVDGEPLHEANYCCKCGKELDWT